MHLHRFKNFDPHVDTSFLRCEFQTVAQKVYEDLQVAPLISENLVQVVKLSSLSNFGLELDFVFVGSCIHNFEGFKDNFRQ